MFNWGGNKFPVEGRTVVLTGGSQGMGLEVAHVLSQKGANVVVVARNSAKLEKAVDYIKQFHWISADVTSLEENERVMSEAVAWNGGKAPDIVWACAGTAELGYFLDASVETLKSQMDINYFAQAYLAQTTLKLWLQSDKRALPPGKSLVPRHFIMTCTCGVFLGIPGYTPYTPPKSALRALFDNLKTEVNLYNGYLSRPEHKAVPKVELHIIFPGSINSPGYEQENKTKPAIAKHIESAGKVYEPLQVAQRSIKGLERGKAMVTADFLSGLLQVGASANSERDSPLADLVVGGIASVIMAVYTAGQARDARKWGRDKGVEANPA